MLKPGGRLFLVTASPEHEIRSRSEKLETYLYKVITDDFRSGDLFAFFDDQDQLQEALGGFFDRVETGRIIEKYAMRTLDFLYGLAIKG